MAYSRAVDQLMHQYGLLIWGDASGMADDDRAERVQQDFARRIRAGGAGAERP